MGGSFGDGKEQEQQSLVVPPWAHTDLLVVVGLPGSGKTTWSKAVAVETGALRIDDFKSKAPDLGFRSSLKLPLLEQTLAAGRHTILLDIDITRTEARSEAAAYLQSRFPKVTPIWVFFANEPEFCRRNILRDTSRRKEGRLVELDARSPNYRIPAGAIVLPVWRSEVSAPSLV